MKPGTENGGDFKPIPTSVPGIEISEHFPKLAKLMQHTADVSQSVDVAMEQAVPEAVDELIDEYLSFHAQVVEEGGKLSLVPGSRLRTHSN